MIAMNIIHNFVISKFILSIAGYTIKILKRHIVNMSRFNFLASTPNCKLSLQFGVEAEKLNLLESLG